MSATSNGKNMARRGVSLVVAITITLILAAYVLTIGIDEIFGVDTTSWDAGTVALFTLLPLLSVLVLFIAMISWALESF